MGLNKSMDNGTGNNASYWRIRKFYEDADSGIECELHGYKDKASRDAGKSPMILKRFEFRGDDYDLAAADNRYAKLYDKIKLDDEFSDATDDL